MTLRLSIASVRRSVAFGMVRPWQGHRKQHIDLSEDTNKQTIDGQEVSALDALLIIPYIHVHLFALTPQIYYKTLDQFSSLRKIHLRVCECINRTNKSLKAEESFE